MSLFVPVVVRRPCAAAEARRFGPLFLAARAPAVRLECIPVVAASAGIAAPSIALSGLPLATWTADAQKTVAIVVFDLGTPLAGDEKEHNPLSPILRSSEELVGNRLLLTHLLVGRTGSWTRRSFRR